MEQQIQDLVDSIRKEGLEEAEKQRNEIIQKAKAEADRIIKEAKDNAAKMQIAQSLQEMLRAVGLDATITSVPFSEYQTRVAERQYDLYIGEVKLKNNLDLTSLFTVQLQQTAPENQQMLEMYQQWRQGTATIQQFLESFDASVPLIPLGTRNGAIYYDRDIYYELRATVQDIFYNIQDW